jgi:RNA polymerase sigma-70 factor (ECF subfamily)
MSGGDVAWADDTTHDVFIRLIEQDRHLDRNESLIGWLLTVATRLCIDKLRRERTVWNRVRQAFVAAAASQTNTPETVGPGSSADEARLLLRLKSALKELPAKEHAAMVMKYVEGLRQTEIAAALDCSEGYVSKLLARALERLRGRGWEVDDV